MQHTVLMYARQPQPQTPMRELRRKRRSLLARLRDDIAIMRSIQIDRATIAKYLRIEPEDVQALSQKTASRDTPLRLTRYAIKALLNGRYAALGGKTPATRAKNLMKIAAAYTYEELLEEPGIGTVKATEIQLWLENRGFHLRSNT